MTDSFDRAANPSPTIREVLNAAGFRDEPLPGEGSCGRRRLLYGSAFMGLFDGLDALAFIEEDGKCPHCDGVHPRIEWWKCRDHEAGDIPCIDAQGHQFVVADDDENNCYCERCGTREY